MTYEEIDALIDQNLADYSEIIPSEHREVEKALLNYIKKLSPLASGTKVIGDTTATDVVVTVSFSNVGTSNYRVLGSLVSKSTDYNMDNDVMWMIREKTSTSFKITLREVAGQVQNLEFDWELKAKS